MSGYRESVASGGEFGSWRHLSGRFFSALSPRGPAPADEAWAVGNLLEEERALWHLLSGPDRRHALGVARQAVHLLGSEPHPRDFVAAALLHDVGKVESSLGTFARVGVTLAALVVGRSRLLHWAVGQRASVVTHDRLGSTLLDRAGSDPLTVSWAAEHHSPPELWTVDANVGAALKAADGD
jgi:hypothetical protein